MQAGRPKEVPSDIYPVKLSVRWLYFASPFRVPIQKFSVFDTQTEDGVTVNSVFGMAYDNDGQLWIGTTNGLFVYNEKKGTLRHYLHSLSDPHSLPDNHIWVIYNDSFGTIWIGTRNGLAKYNQRTDNFTGYISEGTSFGRPACNEIISLME